MKLSAALATSLLLTSVLLCNAVSTALQDTKPASELRDGWYYVGTLGEQKIGVALGAGTDDSLKGHYFYWKDLHDIPLSGKILGPREIELQELNESGGVKATFHLQFLKHDPDFKDEELTIDRMSGEWKPDLGDPLAVRLELRHGFTHPRDAEIEKNIQRFYFAALKGDRNTVADCASFPLRINEKHRRFIRTKAQLLREYDRVFTQALIIRLRSDVPHDMFANWQGIMLADGAVWFNESGRLFAVNAE